MKRCPECRRDYYDDSLQYCLEDGAALIQGSVPSPDEPATAIVGLPTEPETRVLPTSAEIAGNEPGAISKPRPTATMMVLVVIVALALGGLGYWYLKMRPSASGSSPISSIAVLPFQNKNSDPDTDYLSDGLAESLIYRLSQIPELKVAPRSTAFRYKGQETDEEKIGAELGVDAVMSGRLVQRGDNLTISVDLVDVRNKKTLWGEQFERKMSDLLATQKEIADAIADKLQLRISGGDSKRITKQYTTNNEAYQLYLQGRYFWNKRSAENLQKATELLKAATEKDPNFALAYSGLADCYAVSYYYTDRRPRDVMPLAKTFATKAIELDPTLAEPHTSLAFATWLLDWDASATEKEFLRSIEINPNYPTAHHWYSRYLRGMGRNDDAWREINRARELEPLSLIFLNNIAEMQIDRGELDAASATVDQINGLDPNFWAAHQTLGIIRVKQGRLSDALVEAEKSLELSGRGNASSALLAHVNGLLGKRDQAEQIIRQLEQGFANKTADGRDVAIAYVGLGDDDKAFEWLEKAYQEKSVYLPFLNLEPLFAPLHNDPRWADLKRRVGIPN
jgi:TolB-like protein/Tfp pilus assembly protein PilF